MKDKVVVITGGSAGIGAALAEEVVKLGGLPVLTARRERELNVVAGRCGANVLMVVGDMTRRDDVQRVVDAALAHHGRIDVWVNNVGRGITRLTSELTDEDLDQMMAVNVKSALYGMQAVLPHFKSRGAGHLINVSSVLGRVPFANVRSAYAASKHFLNALTASLRVELGESHPGIHVSLVSPGVVATDFGLNALHGGADSRALPFAQEAREVAQVICGVIEVPRADVYSRASYKEQVVAYYSADDMGAAERKPPFVRV
jgi:NAD(P)-dependent dehydrogenase (short-subunit alcohol dehydrogenase family)